MVNTFVDVLTHSHSTLFSFTSCAVCFKIQEGSGIFLCSNTFRLIFLLCECCTDFIINVNESEKKYVRKYSCDTMKWCEVNLQRNTHWIFMLFSCFFSSICDTTIANSWLGHVWLPRIHLRWRWKMIIQLEKRRSIT